MCGHDAHAIEASSLGCDSHLRIKLVGIHQHLVHSPHVVDAAVQSVVCAGIVAAKQRCAAGHVDYLAADGGGDRDFSWLRE